MGVGRRAVATGAKLDGMTSSETSNEKIPGLGRRVVETYTAAGHTRHSASIELGVAYSTLAKWEKGESAPDIANAVALADFGGVRLEWLLRGNGPMFVDPEREPAAPVYPSLEQFIASETLREEERRWLSSQRFDPRLGDIGNQLWWYSQMRSYRALRKGVSVEPVALPAGGRGSPPRRLPEKT